MRMFYLLLFTRTWRTFKPIVVVQQTSSVQWLQQNEHLCRNICVISIQF